MARVPKRLTVSVITGIGILFVLHLDIFSFQHDIVYSNLSEYTPNQRLFDEINSLPIRRLNLTEPVLSNSAKLIVVVLSIHQEVEVRNDIRKTWANSNFSRGVNNGSISTIFLVGTPSDFKSNILDEQNEHGDVLMVDVVESYRNLVYKELAAFRWLNAYFPEKAVAKIDSDVVVDLDKLLFLVGGDREKEPWVQCNPLKKIPPRREPTNKWYVPHSVHPDKYFPSYCNGPLYVFSPMSLGLLLQSAKSSRVFEVEDAFFTGVLRKQAGISLIQNYNIYTSRPSSQLCSSDKSTVIGYPIHGDRQTKGLLTAFDEFRRIRCRMTAGTLVRYYVQQLF